uniref:Serine aminopeptidase S33 domain-containing protein n=1 Tax=Physcomitrium patens TaxID=3218 RepID=A0A2K1IZ63_PHYPA|nr:hypothetical protein PHYPA_024383 [Physcomitrium patens]
MAAALRISSCTSKGVDLSFCRRQELRLFHPTLPQSSSRVSFPRVRRVTVMAGLAAKKTPPKLEKVVLTKSQIEKAKSKMDKFVQKCPGHPDKREYALPYYLLHNEGDSVYGTVIIFHGFSATTTQMSLLAQYLYENGFNVYQPALCGHYFNKPDQYWPKADFKDDIKKDLVKKLLNDPKLKAYVDNFISISGLPTDYAIGALNCIEKEYPELHEAICDEEYSTAFSKFYKSNHIDYFHEAEQRLKEVESLPGPLMTVGLSMGGAAALSIAATHPDKVARTAVFAPLLKIVNEKNVQFSKLTGPLGAKEKGWYPDMPFSLSLMVAVDIYGHFVRQKKHLDTLAKMPTLIVQTEIDDSADHTVGLRIIKEIEERSGPHGPPHFSTLYTAAERVPHPMVHPLEVSQGSINQFWQSLYQETFRFLTEGTVDINHLHDKNQDLALPRVKDFVANVTVSS